MATIRTVPALSEHPEGRSESVKPPGLQHVCFPEAPTSKSDRDPKQPASMSEQPPLVTIPERLSGESRIMQKL